MSRPVRLTDAEIAAHLPGLRGWQCDGASLRQTFVFPGFPEAVAFVQRMVEPAERLNHHPDVDLRYNRVHVTLSTHDQGGLTALDFALAAELTALEAA